MGRRFEMIRTPLSAVFLLLTFFAAALPARAGAATVYAAASLTDMMAKLATGFEQQGGGQLTIVPGASSTLARQIMAGAPVDLFISANKTYADAVASHVGGTARDMFGNGLVIIAPSGFDGDVTLDALPDALGGGRLAVGDPAHVPAGIYARDALEQAGLWDRLENRLAPAGDVRGAVAFVASHAAPFGIVYKTDALAPGVRVVAVIDPALHAPVRYWGVVTGKDNTTVAEFLGYMDSAAGQGLLADEGFLP